MKLASRSRSSYARIPASEVRRLKLRNKPKFNLDEDDIGNTQANFTELGLPTAHVGDYCSAVLTPDEDTEQGCQEGPGSGVRLVYPQHCRAGGILPLALKLRAPLFTTTSAVSAVSPIKAPGNAPTVSPSTWARPLRP